jgi:glucose/arabinose dehydrogenase
MARHELTMAAAMILASACGLTDPGPGEVLKGRDALGDWRQDAPGVRRLITIADMPSPGTGTANQVEVSPMPVGATPRVPEGFAVEIVASGLQQARAMRVAPNGDLFISDSKANEVRVYRWPDGGTGGGKPVEAVFARGLKKPYGIAFYPSVSPQWVYIANTDGVVRVPYTGEMQGSGTPEKVIESIPWMHHWTRDIVFSPDGSKLYLGVGSGSNVAQDMFPEPHEGGVEGWAKSHTLGAAWDTEERRADVLQFDPNGKNEKVFATGLRNPAGITIQPATGQLWAVVNERDELGDDTPLEYATHVQEGAFYGWPWFYLGAHEDPRPPSKRPDLKDKVTIPDVLLQAHTAPLQIAFYNAATGFPTEYRGDAFVTEHGSWNRSKRVGYKVVRVRFGPDGKPTGEHDDFMTGFVIDDKHVWGRPVGVAVGKDGSLFVSEDGNGTIWRVTYKGAGR